MRTGNIKNEIRMTDDAILGTMAYLKSLGITADQYEKVVVLMRLSYQRGLQVEALEHAVTQRLLQQ